MVDCLERAGVQTRNLFAGNLTRHPCFTALREGVDYRVAGSLANTDKIMRDSFWVGVYPGLTDAMLAHIASAIRDAAAG